MEITESEQKKKKNGDNLRALWDNIKCTNICIIGVPEAEGINSRITEAEERISDLEAKMVELTAVEQNKEKRMKGNEDT